MATWTTSSAAVPPADRAVDVLLVGGGVASARCARALRRNGFDGSILLVGEEDRAPYNRPPLSKELLREDLSLELLGAEQPSWYERRSIDLLTGARVERVEPAEQVATLAGGDRIRFERLLLATGAEMRLLTIPGAEGALTLRTADDATRLRRAAIDAGAGAPVVIIGGGFIGLEVASSLASLGLRPTVVELAPVLWGGTLGRELDGWATSRLAGAGVDLRLGARTTRIADGAAWIEDERLDAAFVVIGVGVIPRTALAERAGLRTDDGVVVDAEQRTSHPAIWAAGDVARIDGRARVEHWHVAREAGERAALSMLGLAVPPQLTPWVFSEIGGSSLDMIGAAEGWDDETWLDGARTVLAYVRAGRIVGLAGIGGAIAPDAARQLVDAGATLSEAAAAIG